MFSIILPYHANVLGAKVNVAGTTFVILLLPSTGGFVTNPNF